MSGDTHKEDSHQPKRTQVGMVQIEVIVDGTTFRATGTLYAEDEMFIREAVVHFAATEVVQKMRDGLGVN